MRDWFANLETREQVFVAVGAAFVVIALIYVLLWAPLDKNHRELASSVDNWQRSLAELGPLSALAGSAEPSRPQVAVSNQQAPIIIVDQTLRGRGLEQFRRRSQPTTSNGVSVEFESVAFGPEKERPVTAPVAKLWQAGASASSAGPCGTWTEPT